MNTVIEQITHVDPDMPLASKACVVNTLVKLFNLVFQTKPFINEYGKLQFTIPIDNIPQTFMV